MNLVLVGMRGSGKTTVGRLLAAKLGWPFLDTDVLIQERQGTTISAIFARGGETLFRKLEAEMVQECAAGDKTVIACGGGAILDPRNVQALRANGLVVNLTADAEELWRRVSGDAATAQTRPTLLAGAKSGLDELKELARARATAYAQARHVAVPVGGRTPEEVAEAVVALLSEPRT
ncbi:MAG: shikimate kinase [Planctomycetota bacterium]